MPESSLPGLDEMLTRVMAYKDIALEEQFGDDPLGSAARRRVDAWDDVRVALSGLLARLARLSEENERLQRYPEEQRKRMVADAEAATRRFGFEPGYLQSAWRSPAALTRKYDASEIEAAIVECIVIMGGGTAWPGDGASCAEQIVRWQHEGRVKAEAELAASEEHGFTLVLATQKAEAEAKQLAARLARAEQERDEARKIADDMRFIVRGEDIVGIEREERDAAWKPFSWEVGEASLGALGDATT